MYGKFFLHLFLYGVIFIFFQEEQSGVFAKLIMLKHFIMASNDYIICDNIYINVENIQMVFTNICRWMSHVYKPDLSRLSQEVMLHYV